MRQILFSKVATRKLENLLNYLEVEWSVKSRNDFIEKMDNSINQIKLFPESCPKSLIKKELHKCLITKQTSLFYTYNKDYINILNIIDNRINPESLAEEFKMF